MLDVVGCLWILFGGWFVGDSCCGWFGGDSVCTCCVLVSCLAGSLGFVVVWLFILLLVFGVSSGVVGVVFTFAAASVWTTAVGFAI